MLRDRNRAGGFGAGELMSFLLYTVMIAVALGGLSDLFGTLMNAVGSSDRIFRIFDRQTVCLRAHVCECRAACDWTGRTQRRGPYARVGVRVGAMGVRVGAVGVRVGAMGHRRTQVAMALACLVSLPSIGWHHGVVTRRRRSVWRARPSPPVLRVPLTVLGDGVAQAIATRDGEKLLEMVGVLQLRDVTFSYPTRADVLVLDRVSLTIQPGTVVALCGPSGSGKSSIIQLLERFYDPQGGVILVDGVPLSTLDASWWRKQAALVAQEPIL